MSKDHSLRNSWDILSQYLARETTLPPPAQDAILQEIYLSFTEGAERGRTPGVSDVSSDLRHLTIDLTDPSIAYAIHNDDLALFKESIVVAAALYAALQNPVGVIGGLVLLLYKYRKKRARLTGYQAVVLRTLMQAPAGGWSVHDLSLYLPLTIELSKNQILQTLEELRCIPLPDGTITSFADSHNDLWFAVDV